MQAADLSLGCPVPCNNDLGLCKHSAAIYYSIVQSDLAGSRVKLEQSHIKDELLDNHIHIQ